MDPKNPALGAAHIVAKPGRMPQGVFTSEHVREPGVALDAHQLDELRRHWDSIQMLRDDLG